MNEIYIKELKEYSKEYILNLMNKESFYKLIENDYIKKIDNNHFKFNFVGVIIVDNYIIKCYPKYISKKDSLKNDFNQTMKVIKKYKNLYEDYSFENENLEDISFNKLSMMIYFLEDYYENGVYTNVQNIREINGNGEMDWDKTINNIDPILKDNKPYYGELYTKYKINDLYDYFRLLHEYIITECSKFLQKNELLDLFDLTPVQLSDMERIDFGEDEYILERLEKELNVEFNSHKRKLLKSMYAFISKNNSFTQEDYLTLYGTGSYHVIWEDICSRVFSNKLNKFKDVIKKPKWITRDGFTHETLKTFEPDIVTYLDGTFIILDAKYYNLTFNKDKLSGEPGLGDITKQYLYQLALEEAQNKYDNVKNALLFPKYDGEIERLGCVDIEILSGLDLEKIQIIKLPAGKMNEYYLDNQNKLDLLFWKLC